MGNAMYSNWDSTEKMLYALEFRSSSATSVAFGTIVTHYGVSEWIWNSRTNNRRHRSPTWIVSLLMFWILWTLLYDEMSAPGKHKDWYYVANACVALGGFWVNLIFTWVWDRVSNGKGGSVDAVAATAVPVQPATDVEAPASSGTSHPPKAATGTSAGPPKAKATIDYINNIKIFLMFLVMLYHCAGYIDATLPQLYKMTKHPTNWGSRFQYFFRQGVLSFFMSLFFFYSGYFVPRSFDKKGRYDFLYDRSKRLGIPFVVYSFFLGPYGQFGLQHLFFGTPFPCGSSWFDGPVWFVNQLMMFSIFYAYVCGKGWSPNIPCPSLRGFLAVCLVVGFISGATEIFFPPFDRFMVVPQFWANYLSYPVFFFGGAVAQRNNWMEEIKEKSRIAIYSWTLASFLLYMWVENHKSAMPNAAFWIIRGVVWKGLLAMGASLAVTVFFMDYVNRKYYYLTQFFSKSMYTAYIIQHLTQLVGMKYAFDILMATGKIQFAEAGGKLQIYITDDNLMFPAFLLVSVITLVVTWPAAYAIRSIPGFSHVL